MDITIRIHKALQRMRKRGHKNTEGYRNLRAKLKLILKGNPYKIVDVTEIAIKSYGACIPTCNLLINENPRYVTKKLDEAHKYMLSRN